MIQTSKLVTIPYTNRKVWRRWQDYSGTATLLATSEQAGFTDEFKKWCADHHLYVSPESMLIVKGPYICNSNELQMDHPYGNLLFFFFADEEVAVEFALKFTNQ